MSIRKSIIIEIITALFILLFTYTGIDKLQHHTRFFAVLQKSPVIASNASIVAMVIPIVEILIVLFLFLPRTRWFGLVLSLILMSVFTCYISYMMVFTPHLPCSCGGVIKKLSWRQHLIFNSLFIFLAAVALKLKQKPQNQSANTSLAYD